MNNFNYDLIKLQLCQLENDFNAKMDELKKEMNIEEKKDNFTGWKMYQDGKEVCLMDCSVEEEKKIPEKIKTLRHSCNFDRHEETLYENQVDLADKYNQLIDYLKSKGDE